MGEADIEIQTIIKPIASPMIIFTVNG